MKLAVACSGGVASNMNLVDTIPYVPTLEKRMAPATDLVFNDAPWIVDPAVLSKFVQVSPDVANDVAEKLGCQSLRKSVLSGGEKPRDTSALTCPSAATITARLGSYILDTSAAPFSPAMQFLALDMLEVADALGCTSVQFLHDSNSYPSQSILLPSLAPFQGPAITILFKNCVLDQERAYNLHGLDPSALRERRYMFFVIFLNFTSFFPFAFSC
jgi:sacsin